MMKIRYGIATVAVLLLVGASEGGCDGDSDARQRRQSERLLQESTSQVGMPAIQNFRERKLLKEIYEMRDQASFVTYSYLWNEFNGKPVFLCQSVGYPIPYATQFTNPSKMVWYGGSSYGSLPQADPNGLFSPASAEGTWVLCKDPRGPDVRPLYVEPKVITSPFKLEGPP